MTELILRLMLGALIWGFIGALYGAIILKEEEDLPEEFKIMFIQNTILKWPLLLFIRIGIRVTDWLRGSIEDE